MTNKFYIWWENHRKGLTYGTFVVLFGFYLSPVIKEAKYKNQCIKHSTNSALTQFKKGANEDTLLKTTGLTIDEVAQIEGYKNCIN